MAATKTLAFVLKTQDYRDTSMLASFYTRDFGKVRGIVKGVRDARATYGSTLEPFSLNEILFYRRRRGADLHQVTQVDAVDLFTSVREDLEQLSFASYFTEVLDELVEAEEPSPAIFDLFTECLRFLESGASPKRSARIFEIKLFEALGLMPEIRACAVCQTKDPNPAFFNVSLGGITCQGCRKTGMNEAPSLPVSRGAIHFLEHVRRTAVPDLKNVKVSQEVGVELEKTLRRFVDYHLTKKLKSVIFLEKIGYV